MNVNNPGSPHYTHIGAQPVRVNTDSQGNSTTPSPTANTGGSGLPVRPQRALSPAISLRITRIKKTAGLDAQWDSIKTPSHLPESKVNPSMLFAQAMTTLTKKLEESGPVDTMRSEFGSRTHTFPVRHGNADKETLEATAVFSPSGELNRLVLASSEIGVMVVDETNGFALHQQPGRLHSTTSTPAETSHQGGELPNAKSVNKRPGSSPASPHPSPKKRRTDEMVHAVLAGTDKSKLEALGMSAARGELDVIQLAKEVFNGTEKTLFEDCSIGLAFGDRKKLNTIKLLLDKEVLEPYVDEAERITGLSPLLMPLMQAMETPRKFRSSWAEGQALDWPDMQERLDAISSMGLDAISSKRKYEIFQSTAPAIVKEMMKEMKEYRKFIDYHLDTHNIPVSHLIAPMNDLGYKLSRKKFCKPRRVSNKDPNFTFAITRFEEVCQLPADTLSNTFQKLAAHFNLLCIYHDYEFLQPEEEKHKNAMQAIRRALDCARAIPEEHLTNQGVQKLTGSIYVAALSLWEHFSEEEQNGIEQDAIQLIQTNKDFLVTVGDPFYHTIFQKKFLSNPDVKSRNEFAELLTKAEEKTGRCWDFRKAIWIKQWKSDPTMETLERILKIRHTLISPLEYFDLFQHAQHSEEKQKIAQTVANGGESIFEQTGYLTRRYDAPAESILSEFGLSMVNTYHLLQKNGPHSLDLLTKTLLFIDRCAGFLKTTFFKYERDKYNDKDIQLLVNIAFQAKSVQAELSSAPFVAALCEGRDPAFQEKVRQWAGNVRYWMKNARNDSKLDASAELHDIHEKFAEHCRNEFKRTENLDL